jgi:hypothetical protein
MANGSAFVLGVVAVWAASLAAFVLLIRRSSKTVDDSEHEQVPPTGPRIRGHTTKRRAQPNKIPQAPQ